MDSIYDASYSFCEAYYTSLSQGDTVRICNFYHLEALINHQEFGTVSTCIPFLEAVHLDRTRLTMFKGARIMIDHLNAQPSVNNSLLIYIFGEFSTDESYSFSQVLLLAEKRDGFFILNDLLNIKKLPRSVLRRQEIKSISTEDQEKTSSAVSNNTVYISNFDTKVNEGILRQKLSEIGYLKSFKPFTDKKFALAEYHGSVQLKKNEEIRIGDVCLCLTYYKNKRLGKKHLE